MAEIKNKLLFVPQYFYISSPSFERVIAGLGDSYDPYVVRVVGCGEDEYNEAVYNGAYYNERGIAYKDLEEAGIFFVVAELNIKYRRPSMYDEKLLLETCCSSITAGKVEHCYKLTRSSDGALLVEGMTVLAHVDAKGKVHRIPEFMYPAKAD